jgi:LacI family transcriptional regulator
MAEKSDDKVIGVASSSFTHSATSLYYKYLEARLDPGYVLKPIQFFHRQFYKETLKLRSFLENSRPYALICICVKPEKHLLELYRSAGVPVVLVDETVEGFISVSTDNEAGGYMAGEYLIKLGRKRLGMVSGRRRVKGSFTADLRFAGFLKALMKYDMKFTEEDLVEVPNYSYTDGIQAAKQLLNSDRKLDAIFCPAGDICAAGIIKLAVEMGVKIPEQVALFGYDDIELAGLTRPALTTIKQPMEQMIIKAYETVIFDRDAALSQARPIIFQPELIKRESA